MSRFERGGIERLGFLMQIAHKDAYGDLLYLSPWMPNSIVNEGYDNIWDVYLAADTAPTQFKLGLFQNTGATALDKAHVLADVVPITGTNYAAIVLERSATGWPTIADDGDGEWSALSKQVTFTSGASDWDAAYGAYVLADLAADVLLCFDVFAAARTLLNGDTLDVTMKLKREDPTE